MDREVQSANFANGCVACNKHGHSVWSCPSPKIRVRFKTQFNVALRCHLRTCLGQIASKLLKMWGGRTPALNRQSKKFGYLVFADEDSRDRAVDMLEGNWPGAQHLLTPVLKIEKGLLKECIVCGASQEEPLSYGVKAHDVFAKQCPNAHHQESEAFVVNVCDSLRPQIPEKFLPTEVGSRA